MDSETSKTYSERMMSFVTDPDVAKLDQKYDPYLDIHEIGDILDTCDVIQNPPDEPITGKLIWKTDHDYSTELKRDIIELYNRHFVD
jgi:hypothetical protein